MSKIKHALIFPSPRYSLSRGDTSLSTNRQVNDHSLYWHVKTAYIELLSTFSTRFLTDFDLVYKTSGLTAPLANALKQV